MFKSVLLLAAACAVISAQAPALDDQTAIQVEALNRLKGIDFNANPGLKGAVIRVLEKTHGTSSYVDIVRDFKLRGYSKQLLEYALKFPNESSAVEAFRLATAEIDRPAVEALIKSTNAPAAIQLIGNSNDKNLQPLLHAVINDPKQPTQVRREAVMALARTQDGAGFLLERADKGELPADVKLAASTALNVAPWPEIKKAAAELLPLPQTQNAEPLPPIAELARRIGNSKRGEEIFGSATSACSTCHQVNGKGMDFGPQLSEIGTKLGKEAIYESILDPSAGISFGYEAWSVELKDGDENFGLLASETEEEIAIKAQIGVTTKYKKSDVSRRQKLATSIMPTGLQLTMSTQDLVDLVEYLASLKKVESSAAPR